MSARELDQAALPAGSRTWQNRHFVFTHGFGFTLNPVNIQEPDGLPAYFIRDLGRSTQIEGNETLGITQDDVKREVPIGRAALYFGTLSSPYAIAPSKIEEFDYPEGIGTYNHYSGKAGVPLRQLWQRITASIYLAEPRLLITSALTSNHVCSCDMMSSNASEPWRPSLSLWVIHTLFQFRLSKGSGLSKESTSILACGWFHHITNGSLCIDVAGWPSDSLFAQFGEGGCRCIQRISPSLRQ